LKAKVRAVVLPQDKGGSGPSEDLQGDWVILSRDEVIIDTLPGEEEREVDVTLIPFFAWANRGSSDVRVWLPQASGR
jgi:hypothetical protein